MHEPLEDKIHTLVRWIKESDSIVFLGGAGTSQESGIKPFRGPEGLYDEKKGSKWYITTEMFRYTPFFG